MKKEDSIIVFNSSYRKKILKFDHFQGKNGIIRMHLSASVKANQWRYLLYDRSIEGGRWLKDAYLEDNSIVLTDNWLPEERDEDTVHRFTLMAVDEGEKTVYMFSADGTSVNDDYDRMENMLYSHICGTAQDGENIEALFYLADLERVLRIVIRKQYFHLNGFLAAKVEKLKLKKDRLIMQFQLKDYGYKPTEVHMKLRSKTEERSYKISLKCEKKENVYIGRAEIALKQLQLAQFYWDIKGTAESDGHEFEIQLKNKSLWMHRMMYLKQMYYIYPDGNIVYPYKTKSNEFALQFRPKTEQDNWGFILKEYAALAVYYLTLPYLRKKNIWLVYEKYCVMAQDNGFYFFKYCMENLPESERKRIYYVIDKKTPDYQYVKQYDGRVIHFLSLKHMVYLMAARLLISSDTKAHAYAWHSPNSVYRNMLKRKENVFLQHGVISFKCCHQGLRKKSVNASNLFVVSSDEEKKIILDYFGYDEDEILVTGLARWDVLEDKSQEEPRQIILMPTWRTWLEEVSEEEFISSDYYRHYMSVLNNQSLLDTLEKYHIILNFYIHPKFREYMGAFESVSGYVRIIPFGSEPLNELMMKCSMMITDYSSAVWDVFYQGKPVVFYLFDLDLYNEVQGSYIDMEIETFGDVTHTPEELAETICEYAENNFKEKRIYNRMRQKRIAYIDNKNSERIYQEIAKRYPTSLR